MSKKQISIPFFISDDDNVHPPVRIDEHSNIYAVYSPTKHYINPNKQLAIPTKLFINANPLLKNNLALDIKLLSSPYLSLIKNIILYAPSVLSPTYTGEISPIVWNTSKDVKIVEAGEELCLIEFNVSQPIELYQSYDPNQTRQQTYDF